MIIDVYNQEGEKVGSEELNPKIFDVKPNPALLHQVVVAYQANARQIVAHTKTRGEVRGGGKKPWRQKGTGRARAGSIRSPIWKGGGVVFGPRKEKNYKQKVNQKMRKKALFMALTDKVKNQKLIVLDKLELAEMKTKRILGVLEKLCVRSKKLLIALDKKNDNIVKSASNLPRVKTTLAKNLNALEVLSYDYVLTTVDGIKIFDQAVNF